MTRKEDSEQKMEIKEILVHENYNNDLYLNDIALLQLVQALELRPFVRTVCLPEEEEGDLAIRDNHGTATGWGVTRALKLGEEHTEEDLSNFLKHASFKIQSDELCRSRTQYLVNSTVTFCAGDGRGKSDACKGDSGGAFVLEAKRGQGKRMVWVAAGLVSWGEGCAQEKRYGYYTRVYPFIDWVEKKMKEHSTKEGKESFVSRVREKL